MKGLRFIPKLTLSLLLLKFANVSIAEEVQNDNPNSIKLVTVIVNKTDKVALCSKNLCGQEQPVFTIDLDGTPIEADNLVSVTYYKDYGEKIASEYVSSVVSQKLLPSNSLVPVEEDIVWKSVILEDHLVSSFCWALRSEGHGDCKRFNDVGNGLTEVIYWHIKGQGPVPQDPKPGGITK